MLPNTTVQYLRAIVGAVECVLGCSKMVRATLSVLSTQGAWRIR
jgi:hypothetical protein